MQTDEVIRIFKEKEALLEGHFELASKKHSPYYMQCAKILQYPDLTHQFCAELAKKLLNKKIDIVAGPAIGGIIVAYEMARVLGARAIYAERKEKVLELRRGFEIKEGERMLLVEDVVTTGGSILELVELCQKRGAAIINLASLIDRREGRTSWPFELISLAQVHFPTYEPSECPMCRKGLSILKPGSQKLSRKVQRSSTAP